MDIEKTKAAMPDWIVAKYAKDVAKLARKNVPVASAAAASVAESAAPSLSPVKELVAPSVSPAAETVCQVQSESRSGKNELSSNGLIMCGEASGRVLRTHEEWQARFYKLSKE
ncbi:hypothetical protein CLOM_g19755 [Closterium sp. NIES-68]|nr:hypothetical protein CLOM_g19755 [Closterium sp. NIES-68]